MARYRIQFTYTDNPLNGEVLTILDYLGAVLFTHQFNDSGTAGTNPVIINPFAFQGTVYNHSESFRANYNGAGLYVQTKGADIWEFEGEFGGLPTTSSLPSNITVSYTLIADPLIIDTTTLVAGSDVCNKLDLDIVALSNFNEITAPPGFTETFANTTTKTIVGLNRNQYYKIQIKDANGSLATKNIQTPSYLNLGLLTINVINNTVTILDSTLGLTLEYSLDDSNWQSENTFNGLTNGTYSLYVRDQYGCKVSTTFAIQVGEDGVVVVPDDYFFYSKSNPIRMARREQWDESTIHKNSKNTLSCEVLDGVVYAQKHFYRSADVFTIQIKSNYSDLQVITSNDDVVQTLEQKTANIGTKIMMDCKVKDLEAGSFGIYFISGNYYDYDTSIDNGLDYILNGQLPQFAKIGNIVTIGGFNYTITDVNYNEDLGVDQFVVNSTVLTEGDAIVKAIYNVEDWEVYECSIAVLGRDEFNVQIWYDGQIQYSSELIKVLDDEPNLALLQWSMDYNTDMYWGTGIVGSARLIIDTIKAGVKGSNDIYETDDNAIQTDSNDYEVDVVKFLPQTKEVTRCLLNWLSSSTITLRGIDYVKNEQPEVEALGRSNLYVVTVTLLAKGSGLAKNRVNNINIEIPELLITEADNYIKL